MTIASTDFEFLSTLIAQRTGNVISSDRAYLLESRLGPILRESGLLSIQQLVTKMRGRRDSLLGDRVAEAMTINETSFFRDRVMYDSLRDHVLPALIANRRKTKTLSIWCAACSSGQEPYSVSMLIQEHFPELSTWRVKIDCADYSHEMIERSRTGSYSQFDVNRGLSAKLLAKYFERRGLRWFAVDSLRDGMTFRTCNLATNWSEAIVADLILVRNVLIYFDKRMKEQILARMHRTLRPDGCLFLGAGETLVNLETSFRSEMMGDWPVYRSATYHGDNDD